METLLINRFDGGITNDPRAEGNVARVITNFDALTNPHRLAPYRASESGDSSASTSQKQNFTVALWTATGNYRLFSLGVVSGTGRAEILMKDLTTGGTQDLSDATWLTPANNASASTNTNFNLFAYYKKTGKIYGARNGSAVWAFTPDGSTAFTETEYSVSYTNTAQGITHSNDIFYAPFDNKLYQNNNSSWSLALTLPSHLYITSICSYGNFIAIAAAPLSGVGTSRVFLWDTNATSWSDEVDWGVGIIKVLEETEGSLIGISISGNSTTRFTNRIIFKSYGGVGGAQKFLELQDQATGTQVTSLLIAKQKIDERIYFMMSINLNGSLREGVWSVGRSGDKYTLIHERTPNNDTALTNGTLRGFYFVDDFLFQSYTDNGTYTLSKTNDSATYPTAIYETKINPGIRHSDKSQLINLISVGALYEALPTAGQVVVKHRIQGGTYKTIFTETTDGKTYTEPVAQYSDGEQFNNLTKEHEFRIESSGGAIFTGLIIKIDTSASNA